MLVLGIYVAASRILLFYRTEGVKVTYSEQSADGYNPRA